MGIARLAIGLVCVACAGVLPRLAAASAGGEARCTIAGVHDRPGAVGRVRVVANRRDAVVWLVGSSTEQSLYACVSALGNAT
jgi:hypothetical protein